ncbi:diguanylate cyclase [uncultured Desulfobacter sp.]|uniref:diguanylate cyclase n=1 Tax=uncultured Desulfobacter sp. TaxID=240139 RepID=UPI002AABEF43|nr:diguanylate cyclase [uncultured Desulfobacter sp.]
MDSNKNKTILVIGDTAENLDTVSAILKDYDVIPCTSGTDALDIVKNEQINLILLDILMPEMDGYTVCTKLKQDPDTREIPIIFMTSQTGEENIETAYELGGTDYVTKPFKPRELLARVRVQLHVQEMIRKLDMLETRDVLTGIFNRRKFFELGVTLFNASGKELYALILDIDHLKKINDQYGHHAGDIVLKTITGVIKKVLPPDAIFGRIGGEEFSVMYTSQTHEQAMDIVSGILKAVAQARITLNDGSTISCTISIGIGRKYSEFTSLDSLLKEADLTLFEAKESRQNTSILRDR